MQANTGLSGLSSIVTQPVTPEEGGGGGPVIELIYDVNVGASNSNPRGLTNVGGVLFFFADDGGGYNLWTSDGTSGGTSKTKTTDLTRFSSFQGGLWTSRESLPINMEGTLFFGANDDGNPNNRHQLWISDGTSDGTIKIFDFPTAGQFPYDFTDASGILFFVGHDNVNGRTLWKTDGTSVGTEMVSSAATEPIRLENSNGVLFFTNSTTGRLWKSDGTSLGTVVVDADNEAGSGFVQNVSGTIFFDGVGTGGYYSLRKTTGVGSTLVFEDLYYLNYGPSNQANVNGQIFFVAAATQNAYDAQLWKSDGTSAGTYALTSLYYPYVNYLENVNGTLFFKAADTDGNALWISDGTTAGTVKLDDTVFPTNPGIINMNGTAFFAGDSGGDVELWQSDGTTTTLVENINAGSDGNPGNRGLIINRNGQLMFDANDGSSGIELWGHTPA